MSALDLVIHEIMNGMWFTLGVFLTAAIGGRLAGRVYEDGVGIVRRDLGAAASLAIFVYLCGSVMRSGWIWVLLACQAEHGRAACTGISKSYWVLVIASVLAIIGAACCIRVFSPSWFNPWGWLSAGVLSVVIPAAVHFW